MQKINIPLLGLTTNSEARGAKDGECSILHNLTVDGGGTKVITPPAKGLAVAAYGYKEYFHEKTEQWLCIKYGKVYNEKGMCINSLNGTADGTVDEISFMGNIVIMYCVDGVRYAIFDGGYRYLGKLPKLPALSINIKPVHITTLSDSEYYSDSAEISSANEGLRWKNASKGYYDECLNGLYHQGAFIDRTLFRLAARLFDGSYICYSPIYYVEDSDSLIESIGYYWLGKSYSIGRDNKNFFSVPLSMDGDARSQYFTSVRGFIPSFQPRAYNLKNWRDIIVAIELFATPSIMGHESRSNGLSTDLQNFDTGVVAGGATVKLTTIDSYDRYEWKGAKKIREEITNASLFYRIAEFDLEGKEVWRLDNTSPTQLAVQTRLPLNEQPHELASASFKYIYNGKMHLAGVTELFSDAYDNYSVAARSSENIIQITSVVTIGTEQGEHRVVTSTQSPSIHKSGEDYMLSPLLHYADARANNMRLYVAHKDSRNYPVVYKDFPLTAHKALNLAYYLNEANLGDEHSVEVSTTSENLFVDVDGSSNKDNAFVVAVKTEFPDRTDYSGTYVFTFNSNKFWNLKVTFADATTVEKSNVNVYLYGLRLYSDGNNELYNLIINNVIKEGDTITATLEYGAGTLAGIKPIKVEFYNSKEWKTLTTDEAEFSYGTDGALTSFSLKNIGENKEYTRRNVMRVSQVDNPLFFPAKNTYSFDADIIALCSNTVSVSQGQFGQHPLYVFTDEGIWLMSVDASGAGSYLAQIPCSREICNNAAGVSVTTHGVVFPTTKGLMLINGSEVANISEALAGLPTPELVRSGDIIGRICGIVDKQQLCERLSFLNYLVGAFTAFDYNANLLYVCNPARDYIYVYNNASGVWSTADGQYSVKVEYSDRLILGHEYRGDNGYEYVRYTFDRQNSSVGAVPVVVVTRGCCFSSMGFKRLSQAALRATFHAAKTGFYTLGSIDGINWMLLGGRDFSKETATQCRDIVTSFARTRAFRYFAFAFVGEVRNDARLAFIEVAAQTDFEQKIR